MKILIDNNRQAYGRYVLTGSQIFSLMEGVSESLAGRIAIFHLYPFNWSEIQSESPNSLYNSHLLTRQIISGFYPEFLVSKQMDKQIWFSSYISTYVERDVRNIKAIADQILKMTEIGKECGISQPTVKDWISILESTYLIYLLKPFHNNLSKRLVKLPKIYFVDTGLLCYLTGITTEEQFLRSPLRGNIFENMVIMEFKKQFALKKNNTQFFFYRTSAGEEVDLILQNGIEIDAYEIKDAKTLSKKMAHSLSLFKKDHKCNNVHVLSIQEDKASLTPDISGIHWYDVVKKL